jgi:hypothetical protein
VRRDPGLPGAHYLDRVLVRQRGELDDVCAIDSGQRVGRAGGAGTNRDDERHPAAEEADRRERLRVGPLEVVDEEHCVADPGFRHLCRVRRVTPHAVDAESLLEREERHPRHGRERAADAGGPAARVESCADEGRLPDPGLADDSDDGTRLPQRSSEPLELETPSDEHPPDSARAERLAQSADDGVEGGSYRPRS